MHIKENNQQGFTLFEIILVLLLMGILVSVGGTMAFQAIKAKIEIRNAWDTLGKLRYSSERLVREIREIRLDPDDLTTYDITTWTENVLTFNRYDGMGVTISYDDIDDKIEITYPSITATSQLLSDQVTSFSITYLQSDHSSVATTIPDIAYVVVEMTLSDEDTDYQNKVGVNLRNRMGWY